MSNTVMAVVPDLNRISFSSTQFTTFQTVSFLRYSVFSLVYHIFLPIARENAKIDSGFQNSKQQYPSATPNHTVALRQQMSFTHGRKNRVFSYFPLLGALVFFLRQWYTVRWNFIVHHVHGYKKTLA
jgi:hypothetical protein